jgi:hypothetical protein
MSLGGSEYTLNIKLNVTNLKQVQDEIAALGRGGGGGGSGGGGAPGGGSSAGGVGPGGMNEGGGGRRRSSRSNSGLEAFTAPNTTPIMPNDVTAGGSATGRISRKRNAQMLEVMVTGEHNLDMASAANRQFAFDSQAQFKAQTQSAYAQMSNVMAGGDMHREANRAANRQFVHDSQARFKTETQSAYAQMSEVMALGDHNRAKNAAANAQYGADVRSNQVGLAGRLAADRQNKFHNSAMGKFVGQPNAMGLYFAAVFGGWEVAQAGRQAGLASVAGLGANSPAEYMQAQVQGATAGFGGPLAGMASLPMDFVGRGPTSLAINAAGTAGVYNSQTSLAMTSLANRQAGVRNAIGGDKTSTSYGFAARLADINAKLETAQMANREARSTASLMMAGGKEIPSVMNDVIQGTAGRALRGTFGGTIGGYAADRLAGYWAPPQSNPAYVTGQNKMREANEALEKAKRDAEYEKSQLQDEIKRYNRHKDADIGSSRYDELTTYAMSVEGRGRSTYASRNIGIRGAYASGMAGLGSIDDLDKRREEGFRLGAVRDAQLKENATGIEDIRSDIRSSIRTQSRQLAAVEGRFGYAAGALGISGQASLAARQMAREPMLRAEAIESLGIAGRQIGLQRRSYLEAFRGEQFDVRNIGISSRDQENVGDTLKGIRDAMDEVIATIKDIVAGN